LGLLGLPAVLIGLEPDFGSMMVYLASAGAILLFYRIPKLYWLSLAGLGVVAVLIAWQFFFQPYQKERILGFMSPSSHEQNQAETSAQYNARQAIIAVGSGQVLGRGLGYGIQSHLRFLPERQTDFIFAALAEELGLVGSLLVVGCYGGLIALIIWQANQQIELTRSAYLISVAMVLFVQASVNIGMNIGLLPITGITLPFLSYGGSSILGLSLALAGVQVIGKETKKTMSLQIR
jgi:rod shape determining protein RodA